MIPILHGVHWWLVVANLRDNRFDVLSSWKIKDEEKQVTEIVVSICFLTPFFGSYTVSYVFIQIPGLICRTDYKLFLFHSLSGFSKNQEGKLFKSIPSHQ